MGQEQAGWGFQLDLGLPITPLHQPLLPRLGLSLEEDEGVKVLVSAPGLTPRLEEGNEREGRQEVGARTTYTLRALLTLQEFKILTFPGQKMPRF